jgi:membrane dipeptidase
MLIVVQVVAIIVLVLIVLALSAMWILPPMAEKRMNRVELAPPYPVSAQAQVLHQRLFIADLHADSLLWNRDLLKRESFGHVDLPRLQQANVALQVFASVTKVPLGLNFERNVPTRDLITLFAFAQGWHPRTWRSLLQRALYASEKLHRFAARSNGQIMLIEHARDLDELVTRRQSDPKVVGALLSLEGVHALEGRLENLDVLYDAGFRMIGLHHFFDNTAGGSAHGVERGGLTKFGRALVQRIQQKKMVLDLAHSSSPVVADALALALAPVFVSHVGLRGTADNQRNLSDEQARGVAATGGVMGIALFEHAVGGKTLDDTARAMRYGADLVGADHIGIGSDFDGALATATDVTGIPLLTELLMRHGFTENEIEKIMGGNVLRVLKQILP